MKGRHLLIGAGLFMAVFMVALWYMQFYAFYFELPEAPSVTVADRTVPVQDFSGIDADTSPIKLRTCMTLDPQLLDGLPPAEDPDPLVAPSWFECFDARSIGTALEAGTAKAYLAASDEFHGTVRMVAVFDDGRAFMWRQLSPEFAK